MKQDMKMSFVSGCSKLFCVCKTTERRGRAELDLSARQSCICPSGGVRVALAASHGQRLLNTRLPYAHATLVSKTSFCFLLQQ